ncbi:MAG: lipid-A-disaccharide synthase [Bacteroidota bacterium]
MNYYIIAGEASGDLHGSNLIRNIRKLDPDASFRVWGGDYMKNEGAELVKHINDLAFMGFVEVLKNLPEIINNLKFCKKDILLFRPDVVIFIDYPGFNLRIAEFVKSQKIKSLYYISPQLWAWNRSRVKAIKRDVDKMLVILPFEKDFYAHYNYDVEFVGHPLLDAISRYESESDEKRFRHKNQLNDKPIVALLPGSRKQEIAKMLKTMAEIPSRFSSYQFVVAATNAHSPKFYQQFIKNKNVKIIFNQTHQLLQVSYGALVTSGTATLETALAGVPQIVCYKAGILSYHIAKHLIKVKYISLVNLIMDRQIVKELIQHDFNVHRIVAELKKILENRETRQNIIENYTKLRDKLGGEGASENAAKAVIRFVNS